MDFGKWVGVNDSPDQIKRLASAKKSACTPLSLSPEDGGAIFSGSHGTYSTTLESCTCVDFSRRKLPCKHMFRLAIELGQIDAPVSSDVRDVKRPRPTGISLSEAVATIEALSSECLSYLKNVLYIMFYDKKRDVVGVRVDDFLAELVNAGVLCLCDDLLSSLDAFGRNEMRDRLVCSGISSFNKNMKHADLSVWIVNNVPDATGLFSDAVAVRLSDDFVRVSRKIYTYLGRRLEDDFVYEGDGSEVAIPKGSHFVAAIAIGGGSSLSVEFPDDEITALLDQYGVNRCREWKP